MEVAAGVYGSGGQLVFMRVLVMFVQKFYILLLFEALFL